MSCSRFEEMLALRAGGDLPGRETVRLDAHLEGCPKCREFAAAMAASQAALQSLRDEAVEDQVFREIRRGVLARIEGSRQTGRLWVRPAFAAAAVAVAVALAAWLVPGPRPPVPPAPKIAAAPSPPPPPEAKLGAVAEPLRPRRRPARRPRREQPPDAEPLLVQLVTDDPNVVIYWLIDHKGD
jgi:hypothetical protein